MKPKCLIRLISLSCTVFLAFVAIGQASQIEQEIQTGQKIASEKCNSCHSFDATELQEPVELARSGGPPLNFAGNKFQQVWLEKWLVSPKRIRPAGYLPFRYVISTPAGDRIDETLLPDHPALAGEDAKVVASYLASLKEELNPYPTTASGTSIRAQVHFDKIVGCAACHQARLGYGGLSGPELYTAYERLDRDWVMAFIMDPLYWALSPMPKISIRGDQLIAITDYLLQLKAPAEKVIIPSASPIKPEEKRHAQPLPTGRAEILYRVLCSQCHGVQGNGKGINSPQMFVSPRNHTSFEEMNVLTDERLFTVIKFGGSAVGKSVLMPSWSAVIKDSDINLLVDYLRTLSGTRE